MAVKYGKFEMPTKISYDEESASDTFARFVAEPFERGFGHTVGNSLRRMMLSALEAPAVISVRIEGVPHEYMAIEGVIEDVTNIVLNLKGALLSRQGTDPQTSGREPRIITSMIDVTKKDLDANGGQVSITLGDLVKDGLFEVVNPELHLFTVTKPFKRQVDLKVATGRGYVPSERIAERMSERYRVADEIVIDAAFAPVRLVNYFVENTRVGQDTDFDRLIIEVTTDGRISPQEALGLASQIGVLHFDVFKNIESEQLAFDENDGDSETDADELMDKMALRIDEIELSVRSTNCLSGANIETIAELVLIPEKRMLEFRNFGKKSLNEIKAKLFEMNLHLGMDLNKYGIDLNNVKERMQAYREEKKKKAEQATTIG